MIAILIVGVGGFLVLFLTAVAGDKQNRPGPVRAGAIILVGIVMAGFAIRGDLAKSRYEERALNEPFRVKAADLYIRMVAVPDEYGASDEEILQHCPEAIVVERNAWLGNFDIKCSFSRVEAVNRVTSFHSGSTTEIVYKLSSLVLENVLHEVPEYPYEYWWDLNGSSLRLEIPVAEFRSSDNIEGWWYSVDLHIGGRTFASETTESGDVEIPIDDFEKEGILKRDASQEAFRIED